MRARTFISPPSRSSPPAGSCSIKQRHIAAPVSVDHVNRDATLALRQLGCSGLQSQSMYAMPHILHCSNAKTTVLEPFGIRAHARGSSWMDESNGNVPGYSGTTQQAVPATHIHNMCERQTLACMSEVQSVRLSLSSCMIRVLSL